MFESMQDGVTPYQKDLLDSSCQFYTHNSKVILPEDAWSVDPETGLINIGGDFSFPLAPPSGWREAFLGLRFGKVKGYFNISGAGLEDASRLPREVGKHLIIDDNKFRTLEGIGTVRESISADNNLLVSLEGITKEILGEFSPSAKFHGLAGNPVRSGFLRGDLEDVLEGKETWTEIYLEIAAGEYSVRDDESIEWVLKNKLSPEALGAEIRKAPEKMAVKIAKIPSKYRSILNDILSKADLPPGFEEDKGLLTDLGDVGL